MSEVAIVAALEREVAVLVKSWPRVSRDFEGRSFEFFEKSNAVLVCGGIGPEAARRATEAVVALYRPAELISAGFAGALVRGLAVGATLEPATVVDARDSARIEVESGAGVLVSFASVAGEEQKAKLARAYGAQAVDMEAASVGKGAQTHGLRFRAVKVISDELGFPMPPMDRFVAHDGSFRSASFALYAVIRPWQWSAVLQLARHSSRAARALCARLQSLLEARSAATPEASLTAQK
jgi:adenosylhomocysteine nucleosidase